MKPPAVPERSSRRLPWAPRPSARLLFGLWLGVGVGLALTAGAVWATSGPGPGAIPGTTVAVIHPELGTSLAWPPHGEAAVTVVYSDGTQSAIRIAGGDAPVPIASLAKMMTAYLTLSEHPLALGQSGFEYTVTPADVADLHARAAQGQSILPVAAGERISEYQLLEGMLIPSGNNAAAILGRYDAGGSPARFLAQMNAAAKELGLTHTHYTDPSGLDPGTVSTASDQLRMAQVIMRNPVFAQIVAKPSVVLPVAGTMPNYDTLLGSGGFIGIKPGSDSEAKGCFAFADRTTIGDQQVTIYGVVLGQAGGPDTSYTAASLAAAKALAISVALDLRADPLIG